ncbi:hypothetical protein GGF46_004734 [Coemansia sp. RSA 552]|nr:hypothetical protein GGF46_004734 [Coemansia sp. RSA 552]
MPEAGEWLTEAYDKHKDDLGKGARSGALIAAFDMQPTLMGYDLDDMRSLEDPGFVQAPGPLIDAAKTRQGDRRLSSYYLGYDDADKILWFQIDVTPEGDEVIGDNGWKDKT